jgi:hypothetical protein
MMKRLIPVALALLLASASYAAQPPSPVPHIVLTPGSAPSNPLNGELWMTSAGLFGRVAGLTVGPYGIGGGTGCTLGAGAAGLLVVANGASGCQLDASASAVAGALTLGSSGVGGSLILDGSTSGSATLTGGTTGIFTSSSAFALSGALTFSGLSAGTQVSCLGLNSSNLIVLATGACGSGGGGSGLTVGTSTITSGTTTRVLFDNAGVLGEYSISGTGNVAMTTSPTFVAPALGTPASGVGTNLTGTAAGLTAGTATTANALNSATTTVVVNAATAPTNGQVLTATSGTAANWQTPSASATSFTPGTTTILGATAPCFLVNSTSTTSACDALGTGLVTAAANAVNTSGGLLTSAVTDNTTIVFASNKLSTTATDTVHAGNFTTWNIGGQDDSSSTGTATLPTFAAGQSGLLTAQSGSTVTVGLNSQTVNGLGLNTTLHRFGFYGYTYSSAGVLSAYGFPGFGTITTNAIGKFVDASGAMTASSLTDNGTTISTAETLTLTGLSAGTQVSCMGLNSSNVVVLVASACGSGGGSGTVNSGTVGQIAVYAGSGTAVSGQTVASGVILKGQGAAVPIASAISDNGSDVSIASGALTIPVVLTDGSTIAVNAALSNNFTLTLTASGHTVSNPTNGLAGQWLDFLVTGASNTVSWGTAYSWANGSAPTLTASGATEIGCKITATSGANSLLCYGPVNSATSQAQVSAPVAPANTTTYFMQGLAGAITPKTTGAVILTISGTVVDLSGTAAGNGIIYQLSYGTGSAPANAAALTGTQVGTTQTFTSPTTIIAADVNVPFSTQAVVTGLTVGTAYWIDLAAKSVATASSMGLANVSVTAIEVR